VKFKLLFFLFISYNALGQRPSDSLAKYSYPLVVLKPLNIVGDGTGFLYKKNNTTFLISNYHVIKGMDPFTKKIEWISDSLVLKYKKNNSRDSGLLLIHINAGAIGQTDLFEIHDRLDIIGIKVNLPSDGDFFFINNLIDTLLLNIKPQEVITYGYPSRLRGNKSAFDSRIDYCVGNYDDKFYEWEKKIVEKFPLFPREEIKRRADMFRVNYFFLSKRADGGFSGAPAFGKYIKNGKVVYKFIGLVFGFNDDLHTTWAIKGVAALNYFKTLQ
jgi:hypothetical protein